MSRTFHVQFGLVEGGKRERGKHPWSPGASPLYLDHLLLLPNTLWSPTFLLLNQNLWMLKGKLGIFFYWLKAPFEPKLREVLTGNFHRKAPKWAKKRVKVSKIYQIRPPLHSTYCGNPPILSSELLWESINSFI